MSNAIAIKDNEIIEKLVVNGDLSSLKPDQKSQYYLMKCKEFGLSAASQPFNYLRLSGKEVLYANKGCAEQLRSINKVSIKITKAELVGDLFVVIAEATDGQGRTDSATGAVPSAGLKGEALANAMMKAETKAKRRVTLSICGLNMLDESEIDSIPKESFTKSGKGIHADQPTSLDGAKGVPVKASISKGQFAKKRLEELTLTELQKLVELIESKPNASIEELQDMERAVELIELYEEPSVSTQTIETEDTPICEQCNGPFGISKYPDKFTGVHNWYCFKCKVSKVRT